MYYPQIKCSFFHKILLDMQPSGTNSTDRVRNRLIHYASQHFFHRGFHRTTLQGILTEANVSETEFGEHFASLDDLHHAFLEAFDASESEQILAFVEERNTPLTRFMGVIEALRPWMVDRNFRGCVFINAISEFPDPESGPRQLGVAHYDRLHDLLCTLTQELKDAEPHRYAHLQVQQVADEYLVILTGTIAMGSLYHSDHTMSAAIRSVRRLLAPPVQPGD